MKTVKLFARVVLLLYLFVPIALYFAQDYIFYPERFGGLDQLAASNESFFIETPNAKLQSWFIDRDISDKKPLLVYLGGLTQDVAFVPLTLDQLFENAILTFNYPGYGKSTGAIGEQERFRAVNAALNQFLSERNIKPQQVVLVAKSIGAGTASYLINNNENLGAVVFLGPFDSLPQLFQSHLPIYPEFVYRKIFRAHFDNQQRAAYCHIDALFIIANEDNIAPEKNSLRFFEAYMGKKELVRIPSGHFMLDQEDLYRAIQKFIDEREPKEEKFFL